jgi:hypothetical protein
MREHRTYTGRARSFEGAPVQRKTTGRHVQRKPWPGALPVTAEPELPELRSQAITEHGAAGQVAR